MRMKKYYYKLRISNLSFLRKFIKKLEIKGFDCEFIDETLFIQNNSNTFLLGKFLNNINVVKYYVKKTNLQTKERDVFETLHGKEAIQYITNNI